MKKIDSMTRNDLNCNIFSAYDYEGLTMQELLCQFFTKINECINISNKTFDLSKWLVDIGLEQEVARKLELWLSDGTLESIINVELFGKLDNKITDVMSVNPDIFVGSDAQKLQKAIDYVINSDYEEVKLFRSFDLTGSSVKINKIGEFPRKPIFIKSFNGGIEKHDEGFMFDSDYKNVGDIFISNIKFTSTIGRGTKVFNCSKLIRINSSNNYYSNVDYIFYDDNDYAQSVRAIGDYYTYCKCVCKMRYGWDIHFIGCLCEESYKFIEDDTIERHYISNNISITDCVIENTKDLAISLNGCQSLNISNNYFELNAGHIKLGQYGASGCNISSNFFYDRGDVKSCVTIEGGIGKKYTFNANYVSGSLELISTNENSIKVIDLNNHIENGAILSNNLKVIKSLHENTIREGAVVTKENCGVKMWNVKPNYFELSASEEKLVTIENVYNIKVDDIVSINHNNLGVDVFIYPPRVTDNEISFKVHNKGTDTTGCHLYVNLLKINSLSGY